MCLPDILLLFDSYSWHEQYLSLVFIQAYLTSENILNDNSSKLEYINSNDQINNDLKLNNMTRSDSNIDKKNGIHLLHKKSKSNSNKQIISDDKQNIPKIKNSMSNIKKQNISDSIISSNAKNYNVNTYENINNYKNQLATKQQHTAHSIILELCRSGAIKSLCLFLTHKKACIRHITVPVSQSKHQNFSS